MQRYDSDLESLAKILYGLLTFRDQKGEKSKKMVLRSILSALYWSKVGMSVLEEFVQDTVDGKIWVSYEFLNSKHQHKHCIWDYLIKPQYKPIIESLILETPPLGSPNAHTGENELMILLTCHQVVTKPTNNDIEYLGERKNIKGANPRIYSNISGKDLNKIMLSTFKDKGITPHMEKGVDYGQLMTKSSIKHFNKESEKQDLSNSEIKEILKTWLSSLFPEEPFDDTYYDDILNGVLEDGKVNYVKWADCNLIHFFTKSQNKHENYLIFGDNGQIFHVTDNPEDFKSLIANGIVKYHNQFCRLNRNENCAIYFEVLPS